MSYTSYAEYDPFFSSRGYGPDEYTASAYQAWQKLRDGSAKLGPKGEAARCGWFLGPGKIASWSQADYTCSQKMPSGAEAAAILGVSMPGVTASGMSRNTKIAIGVGVLVGAYLLVGRKR